MNRPRVRIYTVPACEDCLIVKARALELGVKFKERPWGWLTGQELPDDWRDNGLLEDKQAWERQNQPDAPFLCAIVYLAASGMEDILSELGELAQ